MYVEFLQMPIKEEIFRNFDIAVVIRRLAIPAGKHFDSRFSSRQIRRNGCLRVIFNLMIFCLILHNLKYHNMLYLN